jgi:hypothetical protein
MRGTPVKWTKKHLARLGKEPDTRIARSMRVMAAISVMRAGSGVVFIRGEYIRAHIPTQQKRPQTQEILSP